MSVVDGLEPIHVDEYDRQWRGAIAMINELLQLLDDRAVVERPCQQVPTPAFLAGVQRSLQASLCPLALGNVVREDG